MEWKFVLVQEGVRCGLSIDIFIFISGFGFGLGEGGYVLLRRIGQSGHTYDIKWSRGTENG